MDATAPLPSKARKKRFLWITIALVIAALVGGCAIYLCTYYEADETAIAAFAPMQEVSYRTTEDGNLVFDVPDATVGLIFYPGGKVDTDAYKPLMAALASKGILCVLVDMPFHLAVFDANAADGIQADYPEIRRWYIGGHSLGGSMAASYLADHTDEYEGLILLAAYSTEDLSDTSLAVLSILGSEDGVLNQDSYRDNRSNLPNGFAEKVIAGGCHAYFGMYGKQDGDGSPTITPEEQILQTAKIIAEFVE